MEPQINKKYDFFEDINKTQNNSSLLFLKMWKMFLITQYRSFKGLAYFSKYITGTVFAFIVLLFLIMGFDRIDTH